MENARRGPGCDAIRRRHAPRTSHLLRCFALRAGYERRQSYCAVSCRPDWRRHSGPLSTRSVRAAGSRAIAAVHCGHPPSCQSRSPQYRAVVFHSHWRGHSERPYRPHRPRRRGSRYDCRLQNWQASLARGCRRQLTALDLRSRRFSELGLQSGSPCLL